MNKNLKNIAFAVAVAIAGSVLWYGNQPKQTYYPSGELKSSVPQQFFRENGLYLQYNQDGTLSRKYNVVKGIRHGQGALYANGVTINFNYDNGVLSGPMTFDTNGHMKVLEKLKLNFSEGHFSTQDLEQLFNDKAETSSDDTAKTAVLSGKIIGSEDNFLDRLQAFGISSSETNFNLMMNAVLLTSFKLENNDGACTFEGAYQYPKFTTDSALYCKAMVPELLTPYISKDKDSKFSLEYKDEMKYFLLKAQSEDLTYTQQIGGLDALLEASVHFAFLKEGKADTTTPKRKTSDVLLTVLQNLTLGDTQMTINGITGMETKGTINALDGLSDPWLSVVYLPNKKLLSKMSFKNHRYIITYYYPTTQKPFLLIGAELNEKFNQKYKETLTDLIKAFDESDAYELSAKQTEQLIKKAQKIVEGLTSVNFLLVNKNGEKILNIVASFQKGVDPFKLDNPLEAVNFRIRSYDKNAVTLDTTGNVKNGFNIKGIMVPLESLPYYINMDQVIKTLIEAVEDYAPLIQNMGIDGAESMLTMADPDTLGMLASYY